jgi:LysR family transcriptional activator of glutamate synthase operon
MEIQQMEYFCAIAQFENLTKAAQKLHVSQPSLSRSLHALETELGAPLFDRIGRNIVLNDTGRVAYEKMRVALNSTEAVRQEVQRFVFEQNHSIDIFSPVPMGDNEKIIMNFKRKHPDIHIRYGSDPSERLRNIQPDITFFASPLIHSEENYLKLGEEDILLAVSRDNPLAKRESVRLADLSDEPFVRVLPSTLYDITTHMFLEAGFEPKTIIEDQNYTRVLAYVASDFGITLAPAITWFGPHKEDVVLLPLTDVHRKRYLYLKWPANKEMNQATESFRAYLVQYFHDTYGFSCHL